MILWTLIRSLGNGLGRKPEGSGELGGVSGKLAGRWATGLVAAKEVDVGPGLPGCDPAFLCSGVSHL